MREETFQQRKKRLHSIKRPRLNSRRKRQARAQAAMKQKAENYKAWLDSVIGRLENLMEKANGG